MTARPETLRVARRWMTKAEEDIAAAERLLSLDDSLAAVACFHGQQAVEKLLKALLVLAGVPFARTHDVIQLAGLLPPNLAQPVPLEDLAPLNRYAVEARYPIGEEPLTGEEARAAVSVAQQVHAWAHDALHRATPRR
jgi:HEPN domain-containing protein